MQFSNDTIRTINPPVIHGSNGEFRSISFYVRLDEEDVHDAVFLHFVNFGQGVVSLHVWVIPSEVGMATL